MTTAQKDSPEVDVSAVELEQRVADRTAALEQSTTASTR